MNRLTTETRNTQTMHLDEMTIQDALLTINREDQKVPKAIEQVIPQLSQVITSAIQRFNRGGRIIYIGAGTSGRLGVLDAAECVPTFNTRPEEVVGIIAGGQKAMTVAVEGAEDDSEQGAQDLKDIQLNDNDCLLYTSPSPRDGLLSRMPSSA